MFLLTSETPDPRAQFLLSCARRVNKSGTRFAKNLTDNMNLTDRVYARLGWEALNVTIPASPPSNPPHTHTFLRVVSNCAGRGSASAKDCVLVCSAFPRDIVRARRSVVPQKTSRVTDVSAGQTPTKANNGNEKGNGNGRRLQASSSNASKGSSPQLRYGNTSCAETYAPPRRLPIMYH